MTRRTTGVCTIGIFSIQSVPCAPCSCAKSTSLPLFLAVSRGLFGPLGFGYSTMSFNFLHSSRLRPASLSQTSPLASHFKMEQLTLAHTRQYRQL